MSTSLDIPTKPSKDTTAQSVPAPGGLWSPANVPRSMAAPEKRPSLTGTSFPRSTPQWLDLETTAGKQQTTPPRRMTALGEYTSDFDHQATLSQFRQLQHPHIVIRRGSSQNYTPPTSEFEAFAIEDVPADKSSPAGANGVSRTSSVSSTSVHRPTHFQHRDSSASRTSRKSSVVEPEGEVIGEIDLIPCSAEELVAFVDRPAGIKRAMKFNEALFDEIRGRVGDEAYKNVLLPLWETPREKMVDFKWLCETRKLIVPNPDGPEHENFLWRKFADAVGWDGEDEELDNSPHRYSHRYENGNRPRPRRHSTLDPWKEEEIAEGRTEEEEVQCKFVRELREREQWNEPVVLFFN